MISNAVSNVLNAFDVLVTPLITLEPVKCEFKVIHPNSFIYAKNVSPSSVSIQQTLSLR